MLFQFNYIPKIWFCQYFVLFYLFLDATQANCVSKQKKRTLLPVGKRILFDQSYLFDVLISAFRDKRRGGQPRDGMRRS